MILFFSAKSKTWCGRPRKRFVQSRYSDFGQKGINVEVLNIALFLPIDTEGGGLYDKAVEEVNALKKGMGNRIQVAQAGYSVISILFYFAAVLFL